jgi:hypothetical protein
MPVITAGPAGAADFLVINGSRLFIDHWGTPAYVCSLPVATAAWNHVAVTFDGSTIQFYVNGVAALPISGSLYNYSVSTLEIGGNPIGGSSASRSFSGLIDEVYLYSQVLTTAQIQSLYNNSNSGLVSYWSANGTADDSVSGYNGTLMNGATYATGNVNQAFSLDGISSYVQVSGQGAIGGPRTLAAWVKPNISTGGLPVITAGTAGAGDFLVINGSRLFIDHWGTPAYVCSLPVTSGVWNHIAVTFDGSTIQFYVNGVAAAPIKGVLYDYSVGTLEIGGNTIGGSTAQPSYSGLVERIRLYSLVLNSSQVAALITAQ